MSCNILRTAWKDKILHNCIRDTVITNLESYNKHLETRQIGHFISHNTKNLSFSFCCGCCFKESLTFSSYLQHLLSVNVGCSRSRIKGGQNKRKDGQSINDQSNTLKIRISHEAMLPHSQKTSFFQAPFCMWLLMVMMPSELLVMQDCVSKNFGTLKSCFSSKWLCTDHLLVFTITKNLNMILKLLIFCVVQIF